MRKILLISGLMMLTFFMVTSVKAEESNTLVLVTDSTSFFEAIKTIEDGGGKVHIAVFPHTITGFTPPGVEGVKNSLLRQTGVIDVMDTEEVLKSYRREPGIEIFRNLYLEPEIKPLVSPIPFREANPDSMRQVMGLETHFKPSDVSREELRAIMPTLFLWKKQAITIVRVEGGGHPAFDWKPGEKDNVTNQFLGRLEWLRRIAYSNYFIELTFVVRVFDVDIGLEPSIQPGWYGEMLTRLGTTEWNLQYDWIRTNHAQGGGIGVFISDVITGEDTLLPPLSRPLVASDTQWYYPCWASYYEVGGHRYGGNVFFMGKLASGLGINHFGQVAIHEFLHLYGALDEYLENCIPDMESGYLHGINGNCVDPDWGDPCIMRNPSEATICFYTATQIGWGGLTGTNGAIDRVPTAIYSSTYEFSFCLLSSPGDFIDIVCLDGPLACVQVTKDNSVPSISSPGSYCYYWDGKIWNYNTAAPVVVPYYYYRTNGGSPVIFYLDLASVNPSLSNIQVVDHWFKWDSPTRSHLRVQILNQSNIDVRRPWWDKITPFGVDSCDIGFLPDGLYRYKAWAYFPWGPYSPVYSDTFRFSRGAPRTPIITGTSTYRGNPNLLGVGIQDTNFHVDYVKVEMKNGAGWDSVGAVPRSGLCKIAELIGSKTDTLRAISYNANGYSAPTASVVIKAPPNPVSKLSASVYMRPKHWMGKMVAGKKTPDPGPEMVKTNRIDISWLPPVNQLDSIAYYQIRYSYWQSCPNPPWCTTYPTYYTPPICSLYYSLYPLPKNKEIDIRVYAFDRLGDSSACVYATVTTGSYDAVGQPPQLCEKAIPTTFELSQNYPNPFNSTTTIGYSLPANTHVKLTIYNILGQKVKALVNGEEEAGFKKVIWDGRNDRGEEVSSGIYFVKIQAGEYRSVKKMSLIK